MDCPGPLGPVCPTGSTEAPRAAGAGVTSAEVSVGAVLVAGISEHRRPWGCTEFLRGFPALIAWVIGALARLQFLLSVGTASALQPEDPAYLLVSSSPFSGLKVIPLGASSVMGL